MTPTYILVALLGITVADFLFEKWLDWLNDRAKSPHYPKEAEGIYDEARYTKWLAYDKAHSRIHVLSSSISILLSLAMLAFGGFGWVDRFIRGFSDNNILLALLFAAVLGFGSSVISLPFSLYSTFVIEEKFGFNRTTVKTFVLDMVKGLGLSIVLGAPLLAAVVWLYYSLGTWFWLAAWAFMTVVTVFMTMFAASWIMPLFNKFTPLPEGDLRTAIEGYCAKVGFKLNDLFVMDGSKRSAKSNAFFSGLGPKKKIVLYDTLIEQMKTEEIVAVLAHEIGHYKKKHTRQSLIIGIAQTGVLLYLFGLFVRMPEFSQALGAEIGSFHVGAIAFGIILTPLGTLIGIAMNMLSRKNEFEADAYAKSTYAGEPLASGLKKLTAENLSNLKPHPWYAFVHYSHPPVLQRLERLF